MLPQSLAAGFSNSAPGPEQRRRGSSTGWTPRHRWSRFLGALTGLGGGIVVIPLLTLLLGVDIRYAAGAALISVIATSSGAASSYVKDGYSNLRVGMFLEIATTVGAVVGALLTAYIAGSSIAVVFGVVLLASAYLSLRTHADPVRNEPPDPIATQLRMDSSYPTPAGLQS